MKWYSSLIIAFLPLLFSNCDKNSSEPEFDPSLIPGIYVGNISYREFTTHYADAMPGETIVSNYTNFTITNIGELKFNLSVETSQILPTPSIDFLLLNNTSNGYYGISYLENDPNYCKYTTQGSSSALGSAPQINRFSYDEYQKQIQFQLMIKKTKPDSVHFIEFWINQ